MAPRLSGCAAERLARGESTYGTAPEGAASWLLVEHPGPWPSQHLPGDMPSEAADVFSRATESGIRPQLIRRVSMRRREGAATVFVGSCRVGRTWLERRSLADLRDLAELDLAALANGNPPQFGVSTSEPVLLVCTHGRRDVCCARLGRPIAVLLDKALPGQVWETAHVGGDRFAPNVVALPDGSYHGALTTAVISDLVAAVTSGRVLPSHFRGRAGLPSPVQAADHFIREHCGVTSLDAVRAVGCTSSSGAVSVELLVHAARWRVRVHPRQLDEPRLTSCAGDGTVGRPTTFHLLDVQRMA